MANKRTAIAAALVLTAGLAACATPTPYQPNIRGQAASGGFSEARLDDDRWRVTFSGNTLTARETVEGYLLYRAAELTREQGRDWFRIVQRETSRDARSYVEPDPFYRPWYGPPYIAWRPSWRFYGARWGWRTWDPFWGDPFWPDRTDVRTVEKFEVTAEIVMGVGAMPADDPGAFDARRVLNDLGPRIVRPAPAR